MKRLLGYLWPYSHYAIAALVAIFLNAVLQLAQPYLIKVAIDNYIAKGDLGGVSRIAVWFLAVLAGGFALEFAQTWLMNMIGQRIMFDMRMQIWAPAAARSARLRQESGRPPDDPRHQRHRRPQRSLLLRHRRRVRRRVHAGRDHDRAADDGLAAVADCVFGAAADLPGDGVVPRPRARIVSDGAHADRADQRVPAGEHHRDGDGAAVPAGNGQLWGGSTTSTASTATRTSSRSSITRCSIRRSS